MLKVTEGRKNIPYARSRKEKNLAITILIKITYLKKVWIYQKMNQSARSKRERKVWIISILLALTGEQSVLGRQNDTNAPTYCRDNSIRPAKPDAMKHVHYPTNSPCSDSMPTSYLLISRLLRMFVSSEGMNGLVCWEVTFVPINYSVGILYSIFYSPVDLVEVTQHA